MQCPGHQKRCKFCGGEKAYSRAIDGMKQVDRLTGEPIIDYCCNTCKNNRKHAQKKWDVNAASKFKTNIPFGDE